MDKGHKWQVFGTTAGHLSARMRGAAGDGRQSMSDIW